jgi:Cdc6-like AAA superfamily ATPase
MKYYESHYEEYISSVDKYNLHPELVAIYNMFPQKINQLENLIIYGPSGVGKYSQILYLLRRYSPSELKYDKKITITTDKQEYIYRISDIHYEIDMSQLGCNSKLLWHE